MREPSTPPAFLPQALVLAGILEVPLGLQEAGTSEEFGPGILAVRATLAVVLITCGAVLGRVGSMELRRGAANAVIVASIFGSVPVIVWTGGIASPACWLLTGYPLFVALVIADVRSILVSTAAVAAVGLFAEWRTGARFLDLLPWTVHLAVSTSAATWACRAWLAVGAGQRREEEARLAAVRRMAEIERARAHDERLASIGRMVSGLAHELNNPLSVIRANIEFLQSDTRGEKPALSQEEREEIVGDARESALRIQKLVSDMRAFTKREDGSNRAAVLDVLESSVRFVRAGAEKPVAISVAGDGSAPVVAMGSARLEQALVSILLNAVDAVGRIGPPLHEALVEVDVREHATEIRIRISDNGPGIAEAHLPRIFEPFFTTKDPGKGTGLGLAIAHQYVAQARGRITAANAPGGGAIIEISLPKPPETIPDARTSSSPSHP